MLICSGCGGRASKIEEVREREVRDLPWRKYQTTVMVEYYRIRCSRCGLKTEQVPQLPTKAPFSKDFEDAVGLACDAAAARQVARQFGLAASTVRAIDLRCLECWNAKRRKPALRQMGVDAFDLWIAYHLLSTREREVLRYIARGYPYKEVAHELGISVKTVETHVSSVLRKLQLSSRHELTAWAMGRQVASASSGMTARSGHPRRFTSAKVMREFA